MLSRVPRSLTLVTLALVATLGSGCSALVLAVRAISSSVSPREVRIDEPVRGDTRQPDRRRFARCASHSGQAVSDQAWRFTATHSTSYVVRVRALHDATVSVFDGDRELACDDDGAALAEPRVTFAAHAGHTYSIVVDGYRAERGPYELVVSR